MKKSIAVLALILALGLVLCSCGDAEKDRIQMMEAKYGENKAITGDFDKEKAVRCENGTFVGSEENGVLSFKGVPYAKPPVGDLRWKPPVQPRATRSSGLRPLAVHAAARWTSRGSRTARKARVSGCSST